MTVHRLFDIPRAAGFLRLTISPWKATPAAAAERFTTEDVTMKGSHPNVFAMPDKNYSWKGSPNAGRVLALLAVGAGVLLVLAGFS